MKRQILSLLLALVFCLGLCPVLSARAAGPVQIATAEELIAFAQRVNGGERDLDAVLTQNVSLIGVDWTESIGNYDQHSLYNEPGYTGTFDGGGHQIYGLYDGCSIFGKIDTGGVVKDLRVEDAITQARAILAYACAGTISNCHVSGTITPVEDWSLPLIGGIVAELGCLTPSDGYAPGTVMDCTSDVDIRFYPREVEHYGYYNIGGIVGTTHKGVIDRCFFSGNIELQGGIPSCSAAVGGIAGSSFGAVINCGNTGGITADVVFDTSLDSKKVPVQIGGIVGHQSDLNVGKEYGRAVNCWSTGDIQVTTTGAPAGCNGVGGGIRGYAGGLDEMRNCWSTGTVTASSNLGSTEQPGSDTCYFLEGTNYNSGNSPTLPLEDFYNGVLVGKLNDYVRDHPGEGLLAWVQGSNGPELSDSYTPSPTSGPSEPSTPSTPSVTVSQTPNATGFTDVGEDRFYYQPVLWAVENKIAGGTGNAAFSPNNTCTQAEILTFLWRAAGCPEPRSSYSPFPSVSESDYFCKPVLWAWETGALMAGGDFDPARFNPKAPCTRLTAVYYIWAALGYPEPAEWVLSFQDVDPYDMRTTAVIWAADAGVTGGTGEGTFSPLRICSRAEIVTFLYRAYHA